MSMIARNLTAVKTAPCPTLPAGPDDDDYEGYYSDEHYEPTAEDWACLTDEAATPATLADQLREIIYGHMLRGTAPELVKILRDVRDAVVVAEAETYAAWERWDHAGRMEAEDHAYENGFQAGRREAQDELCRRCPRH